jgi:Ca2+-binding EF-hand superfamily protein
MSVTYETALGMFDGDTARVDEEFKFDTNGDGVLTGTEYCDGVLNNEFPYYCGDWGTQLILTIDIDGDGQVSYTEFLELAPHVEELEDFVNMGHPVDLFFHLIDLDNDFYVQGPEVAKSIGALFGLLTDGNMTKLIEHVTRYMDKNGDGVMDLEETSKVMREVAWLTDVDDIDNSTMVAVYDRMRGNNTKGVGQFEALRFAK